MKKQINDCSFFYKFRNILKKIILLIIICSSSFLYAQQKDYAIQALPFTQVMLSDNFWLPRIEINRTVTIPASFERCQATGRVNNFVLAAQKKGKFCTKYPFDDTDVYKTLEGAAFSLAVHPDAKLNAYIDSLIDIIAKAQEPDGYLYTARTIDPVNVGPWLGKERWEKERELSHELYNAGHLYEAAAAHFAATKKRNLLNVALKNADLVCSVFGPGKKTVAPGHEIIEMGLVKLYRITGKQEYLATAKFFIEARGQYTGYDKKSTDPWKNGAYWQDRERVVMQTEAEGHAVRAGYLYSAVADVAALTGDDSLLHAIDDIWNNVVSKKIYVQGGVGALGDGERYGANYELPNASAYNETCAAIANVYWNQRMFLLHGNSKYIDLLEKILYNGLISGIGLDGKSFFYTNAMEVKNNSTYKDVEATRSGWFECSCCPTNLARLIPSIPGYIFAQKDDNIYVNLFIAGSAKLTVNKVAVQIIQQNNYPWDGALSFTINPAKTLAFNLLVRMPGWAQNEELPSQLYTFQNSLNEKPTIKINGTAVSFSIKDGYAVLNKIWEKDDKVEVMLPMEIRKVVSSKNIPENDGKVALQRGPVMYCAEWVDNFGKVSNLILPSSTVLIPEYNAGLLNGIMVLKGKVPAYIIENNQQIKTVDQLFTAIPYYSWANRGKGEMMLWLPTAVKSMEILTK